MAGLWEQWCDAVLESAVSVLIVGGTAGICFVTGWQTAALIGAVLLG